MELLLKDEVYAIVGAAIEVHRVLGPGFLEAVYQEAFEIELECRLIPFEFQKHLKIVSNSRKKETFSFNAGKMSISHHKLTQKWLKFIIDLQKM